MAGFAVSEWIARPPQQVFEFLSDAHNAPQIVPAVKTSAKLTEGPPRVGTRYRETRLINGREEQAELEVTEYTPPAVYAMQNVTSGITTTYRYQLRPEQAGTRINLVCTVKAAGLKRLLLPLVASALKQQDGTHLQTLKTVLEAR